MTGQSDWLGNAVFSFQDADLGVTASISYNYTGERIRFVGERNAPDIIEEARGRVDVLFKYDMFLDDLELQFEAKAQNILDEEWEWTQGGLPYERWDPGITYSVGVSARF
jgi:outer membrane receptor protein involved in Fe transport